MELTINGKVYAFKFGIKFIRELDKIHFIAKQGIKFGAGVDLTLSGILNGNLATLSEYLNLANKTEKPRISEDELDEFLETSCEDIEKVYDAVVVALKESNATKIKLQAVQKTMDQAGSANK